MSLLGIIVVQPQGSEMAKSLSGGVGNPVTRRQLPGELVNHKRVKRLYTGEKLQVRRRKRKKVPVTDRQPLVRPQAANAVWSMDSKGWCY